MAASEERGARQAMIDAYLNKEPHRHQSGNGGQYFGWLGKRPLITLCVPYEEMMVDDVTSLWTWTAATAPLAASSEWRFHRDILLARDATLSCTPIRFMPRPLPFAAWRHHVHYMIAPPEAR
jgi:hypothetical protein